MDTQDTRQIGFKIYQADPFFYSYLPGILRTISDYVRNDYANIALYDYELIGDDAVSYAYCLLLEARERTETEEEARKYFVCTHRFKLRDYLYREYSNKISRYDEDGNPMKEKRAETFFLEQRINPAESSSPVTIGDLTPDPTPTPEQQFVEKERQEMIKDLFDDLEEHIYRDLEEREYTSRISPEDHIEALTRFVREPEKKRKDIINQVAGDRATRRFHGTISSRYRRFKESAREKYADRFQEIFL